MKQKLEFAIVMGALLMWLIVLILQSVAPNNAVTLHEKNGLIRAGEIILISWAFIYYGVRNWREYETKI